VNKHDFINQLARMLGNLPEKERKDILYDYEEHFTIGIAEGKTEEEISRSLGDPRNIARQYKADSAIRIAEKDKSTGNIFRAVFAAGLLGFLNLLVVLTPFILLNALLLIMFASAFGITITGVVLFIASFVSLLFPGFIDIGSSFIFATSLSVGLTCMGLLFLIGTCYVAKYFYKITISYLKWNVDFINNRRV
jgi:uncharacterized membrane protein